MNRSSKSSGRYVRKTTACAVVAGCLFGFVSESVADNKLPTRVPPASEGGGHASAKFRVAITILPVPAASKAGIAPQRIPELDGSVEHFSDYTVKTTVADTHITMDVE